MHALRAIRVRVVLLAIIALLLHASVPALHVHAHRASGGNFEWTEVCTGSGNTVLMRVDASTGDVDTAPIDVGSGTSAGDRHCLHCAAAGGAAPAAVRVATSVALASPAEAFESQQAPDRALIWFAEQSRAPPPAR